MDIQAQHVICILNDKNTPVRDLCKDFDGFEFDSTYSLEVPDERMEKSFAASIDRVHPSFTDEDWQAVGRHTCVSYILSPHMAPENALAISRQALSLVAAALRAGAFAAKGESSGIAHGRERWLALDEAADKSPIGPLIGAWVRFPIECNQVAYSVGMHLLGAPDVEIEREDMLDDEMVDVLSGFIHFLLIDKPILKDGHTFKLGEGARRFEITGMDCDRYESDSFFWNPLGYWRLSPIL